MSDKIKAFSVDEIVENLIKGFPIIRSDDSSQKILYDIELVRRKLSKTFQTERDRAEKFRLALILIQQRREGFADDFYDEVMKIVEEALGK